MPHWGAKLLPLYIAVEPASNGQGAKQASLALRQGLDAQSSVDQGVRQAVATLLAQPEVISLLQVRPAPALQRSGESAAYLTVWVLLLWRAHLGSVFTIRLCQTVQLLGRTYTCKAKGQQFGT